jgi:hypothetical protein
MPQTRKPDGRRAAAPELQAAPDAGLDARLHPKLTGDAVAMSVDRSR